PPAMAPSTAAHGAPPGDATTPSGPRKACPAAGWCSSACSRRPRTSHTMASTEIAPLLAPTTTKNPAARVLLDKIGPQVQKIDDFRGDLAITVHRNAWVE